MSENVELVRRAIEAWNRRDPDLWLSYAAPEIEWMPAGPAAVEGSAYRGYDEVSSGLRSAWDSWEELRFEESEVRDLDGAVLWLGRVKMRGAASHVELDQEFGIHFVLRDRKLVKVQSFPAWREALDALRLTQ